MATPLNRRWFGNHKQVYLKARIDDLQAVCIVPGLDFATFLVAKSNLAVGQTHRVAITYGNVKVGFTEAHGHMQISALKNASESGETWMVSGTVTWNTAEDSEQVTTYFANPFAFLSRQRKSLRVPVSIPATVDDWLGECVDISKSGLAVVLNQSSARIGDKLDFTLILSSGAELAGVMTVQNQRLRTDGKIHLGGTVKWDPASGKSYTALLPLAVNEIDETRKRYGI